MSTDISQTNIPDTHQPILDLIMSGQQAGPTATTASEIEAQLGSYRPWMPTTTELRKSIRKELVKTDWIDRFDVRQLSQMQCMFLRAYFSPTSPTMFQTIESAYIAGVSRDSYLRWLKFEPFLAAMETIRQYQVEQVEMLLYEKVVIDKDLKAIQYFLDRVGGDRWNPKARLDIQHLGDVQITFSTPGLGTTTITSQDVPELPKAREKPVYEDSDDDKLDPNDAY